MSAVETMAEKATRPQDGRGKEGGDHTVEVVIEVNRHSVTLRQRQATGTEIKVAAIAQGVNIPADAALFEVQGQGKLTPVGDQEVVKLHNHQKFRAIAPDDNS